VEEERREIEQPKEEYQTPDLVKHGTVEDLTQSGSNPAAADTKPDASAPTDFLLK
jgi:hypothetical protein